MSTNSVVKKKAGAVGYKSPPLQSRIRKGDRANPAGRPKGTPNAADILQRLLNTHIMVTIDQSRVEMPIFEAIFRKTNADAKRGDPRALDTVDWFSKTFGDIDVTSEERRKRTFGLPRTFTKDEYDFLNAPAREKDRQYCYAIRDRQALAATANDPPLPIEIGDECFDEKNFSAALKAYIEQLHADFRESEKNGGDLTKRRSVVSGRIGILANEALFAGDFHMASECAKVSSLASDKSKDNSWIKILVAHANMFLEKIEEARAIYLSFNGEKNVTWTNDEVAILRDFDKLRKSGLAHPLMAEIEQKLMDAGWTALGRRERDIKVAMLSNEERFAIVLNDNELETAALLIKASRLSEAKVIYERILTNPKIDPNSRRAPLEGLTSLAEQFFARGHLAQAIECCDVAALYAPERYRLQAIRAHALMFLRSDEARSAYLRNRGKNFEGKSWEASVLQDFNEFRINGRGEPLMVEIEQIFNVVKQAPDETN